MKKPKESIKQITEELLALLEIDSPDITLKKDKENCFHLTIETPDSGILIGFHGENLYAFQLILNLIIYKKLGTWQRIVIDIAGWREKRDEQLKRMALAAAQKVKFSQKPIIMPYLNAAERRIIHLTLSDYLDINTRSDGQGEERRLIIELKKTS